MVNDVGSPEEAAFMAGAVEPVITEFIAEKEQDPRPPRKADRKNREAMQVREGRELDNFGEQIHSDIAEAHGDAGGRVLQLINLPVHDGTGDGFDNHECNESGDREVNQVLHRARQTLFYTEAVRARRPAARNCHWTRGGGSVPGSEERASGTAPIG